MQFVLSVKITGLVSTVPGLAVGPVLVPLIRPYMYCLRVSLTPFHHFFLTYLLPFPMRIDPLHYHRPDVVKERLNMALVFCVYFVHFVHFFWLVTACFCHVLGLVLFPHQAKSLASANVSEMTYFVSSGAVAWWAVRRYEHSYWAPSVTKNKNRIER